MRVRVKICGITRAEDAEAAAEAGADAVGLVFHPASRRAVEPAQARAICAALGPFVTTVALFVDPPVARVREVLDTLRPDLLQFHGGEDEAFCTQFGVPYVKALHVGAPGQTVSWESAHPGARGVLLDTWDPREQGGTGRSFDWAAVAGIGQRRPMILAGGLHAGNVEAALAVLRPWAVDVSTGVESAPGLKDSLRIREFMQAVRRADAARCAAEDKQ